jgi:hypothetical protein
VEVGLYIFEAQITALLARSEAAAEKGLRYEDEAR